jgi:UDP-N-acetylmuramoylalanine--D-glutamate ligase
MTTETMERPKAFTADELRRMEILVVGLARSGFAACNVLRDVGSAVKVTDHKTADAIDFPLDHLRSRGVDIELGQNSIEFARDCDLVVVSPGVPLDIDVLRWAHSHGKPVISEVELAYCLSDARFVAVTGTNGKSTTVSLLGEMLAGDMDRVRVGGNIGDPISAIAAGLGSDWVLVIEVSSFQLDTILSFRPAVSVLLNITPDHLDRYSSYEDYVGSKARIFENQAGDDIAIINYDDADCVRALRAVRCKRLGFSLKHEIEEGAFLKEKSVVVRVGGRDRSILLTDDLRIRGPHNLANTLAATLAATVLQCQPKTIRDAARGFRGLEHRLEHVAMVRGVDYINDSKATNVDALVSALVSVSSPVVLIAGGRDKGGDFSRLSSLVRERVKAMIVIGEASDRLSEELSDVTRVLVAADLEEAVKIARDSATDGETVLLSPGCASYDMFRDFEHRGRVFKKIVMGLKEEDGGLYDG